MYKLFMYCNKICFCSLYCPLSVQNFHKLKRIHTNIVQNPTFLGHFQTFGGQCKSNNISYLFIEMYEITFANMLLIFGKIVWYIYTYTETSFAPNLGYLVHLY